MGKLDPSLLRFLSKEDFAILTGIEMGMKNHELVSAPQAIALSKIQRGGANRILRYLCRQRLLMYERGKKYDGYRLTNLGYDFLALKDLCKRNVIHGFGHQIGVGKESNIFIVANQEEEELCLKLHRLGRVCFKKVTEKRDYHKRAKSLSWLYLSKLSATKEFAYMKALHDEGFPVPKPISFNRHCVIMELIKGTLLNHISELEDTENLYDQLMELIVRFANSGLIHGDFNEFNIMITDEENPIIIDFPQMLSTEHSDAQMYFERDVNCIRTFFKKRFRYESELFPKFSDINRTCSLDAKIHCTGFTREMARRFNIEIGLENETSDHSEDENDDNNVNEDNAKETLSEEEQEESIEDIGEQISNMNLKESEDDDVVSSSRMVSSDESFSDSERLSVASTCLSEIKFIVKQERKKKMMKQSGKKCRVKGEASAVGRSRRQNAMEIKRSQAFWSM